MKRTLALVTALALLAPSLPALAQTPAEVAAARKKFDLALDLEKKGEWKAALTLLRDVAAVKATSQVRFHIALCLERTGKLVAARDEYVGAKEEAETKEGAEGITMQKKSVERIADLEARIPKLEFVLPEDVVSAKLSIDGGDPIPIAVKPIVPVDPGDHQLVVSSTGRKTWKLKITVKEKDPQKKIEVPLKSGSDDEPEKEPEKEPEPPKKPPPPPPPPVQRPTDWNRYALPMVLGGVAGVSLVTSIVVFAMRGSTISDMDSACGPNRDHCPNNVHSLEDRGHTYTTVGNVLLVGSVLAAGAAVVIYVVDPMKKSKTTVGATATPTGMALALTGQF